MTHVNLMPADRREAVRRRSRLHAWALGLAAWCGVLLVALLVFGTVGRGGRAELDEELATLDARLAQSRVFVDRTNADMADLDAHLTATRAIGRHPNWAVLLALLGDVLGDSMVLDSVRVEAPEDAAPRIELTGFGESQAVVSRFVLRLEGQDELFSHVKLLDTRREPFLADEAFAFRIACTLRAEAPSEKEPSS